MANVNYWEGKKVQSLLGKMDVLIETVKPSCQIMIYLIIKILQNA